MAITTAPPADMAIIVGTITIIITTTAIMVVGRTTPGNAIALASSRNLPATRRRSGAIRL
jgi:hypothetical protein